MTQQRLSTEALNLHIARVTARMTNMPASCRTARCRHSHRCHGAVVAGNWPRCMGALLLWNKFNTDQPAASASLSAGNGAMDRQKPVKAQQSLHAMEIPEILPGLNFLLDTIGEIRRGTRPTIPPEHLYTAYVEELAIYILLRCLPKMKHFAPHFHDWLRRRALPPLQPGQALAECRAAMREMGLG